MPIKHLISPGIGFSPGSVKYIVTRGLLPGEIECPRLTAIPLIFEFTHDTEANILADTGGYEAEPAFATDTNTFFMFPADGATPVRYLPSPLAELEMQATATSDVAPNDDTTDKKITLQKLASPPTNAAYVAFSNNPGGDVFYLVLEED